MATWGDGTGSKKPKGFVNVVCERSLPEREPRHLAAPESRQGLVDLALVAVEAGDGRVAAGYGAERHARALLCFQSNGKCLLDF